MLRVGQKIRIILFEWELSEAHDVGGAYREFSGVAITGSNEGRTSTKFFLRMPNVADISLTRSKTLPVPALTRMGIRNSTAEAKTR